MTYVHPRAQTAVIPIGTTRSQALLVAFGVITGLLMPDEFTGTVVTFEGCDTVGGTFLPIYDSDGNQVSLAVAVDRAIGLSGAEADAVAPFPYVKVISGSTEVAERAVTVIVR